MRQDALVELAIRRRPGLLAAAYLLYGEPTVARDAVDAVLARLYADAEDPSTAHLTAYARLVDSDPARLDLPWRPRPRMDLVDAVGGGRPRILADLADLAARDPRARAAVVLDATADLTDAELATVLGLDAAGLERARRRGLQHLGATHPPRADRSALRAELRSAIPAEIRDDARSGSPPGSDIAHGRMLIRRRRLRAGLAATAAAVLLGLGVPGLLPDRADERRPVVAASTRPAQASRSGPVCEPSDVACQVTTLRDWRRQMAHVVESHLDPGGHYFSGYSYGYGGLYDDTDSFWGGGGGALGFELFRLSGGATSVFVHVASSREFAVRCGQLTGHPCASHRFMDGNRFTLTLNSTLPPGIEVQHCPEGDQVITVVARTSGRGTPLPLGTGDLMQVAQDRRLRLPPV